MKPMDRPTVAEKTRATLRNTLAIPRTLASGSPGGQTSRADAREEVIEIAPLPEGQDPLTASGRREQCTRGVARLRRFGYLHLPGALLPNNLLPRSRLSFFGDSRACAGI